MHVVTDQRRRAGDRFITGKRCVYDGCSKSAESNTTFCNSHGGSKQCRYKGCTKAAHSSKQYCGQHGGRNLSTVKKLDVDALSAMDALDTLKNR